MAGSNVWGRLGRSWPAILVSLAISVVFAPSSASAASSGGTGTHEGVASCSDSMCHGRQVASGLVVRQNELITWQDPGSAAGDHSRAWRVLTEPRAQAIANRLGLGPAQDAKTCLGCHADPAPGGRGAKFQISDGVGCEACHGGSSGWLASHYAVGAGHAENVARGMIPLEDPKVRASVCLDCHYGSAAQGQFVTHQIMSAGHPRISFELDLFSTLQRHYDLNADYAKRKPIPSGVKIWAVGQSMALERALTLYSDARRGQQGVFPEFYFFDCHSCHRAISDDAKARPTAIANPGRPIPSGTPPFNDENMIMLSAAAKTTAPGLAASFEANSRAFHAALTTDRGAAVRAAGQLAGSARALESAFEGRSFSRGETVAILSQVVGDAESARYTDYTGSTQAVMAIDTLLNAMVAEQQVSASAAAAIRPDINRAYRAVRDPNAYRPAEFHESIQHIAAAVRSLR
jgi:hypothetical protein